MSQTRTANLDWPIIFGTSAWFPDTSPVMPTLRAGLALIFVVHLVISIAKDWDGGYYLIYLTHWSFITETLYLCFATYTAYSARRVLLLGDAADRPSEGIRLPWFVTTTWILQIVAMPAALLVFVLYWLLDNPIYALKYMPSYMGFFVHAINFLLLLLDLFLGRNVFYMKYTVWFFAYAATYCIWTLFHFMLKVGTADGCDDYPKEKCPIYKVLNWNKATPTSILAALIVFCVAPLCQYPLWWCNYKRRMIELDQYQQSVDETEDAIAPAMIGASV